MKRNLSPEIMDGEIPPEDHHKALTELRTINALSFSTDILWRALPKRPLKILDIASGGGDIPIRLCKRAQKYSLQWEITGSDINPSAIRYAREFAKSHKANVQFVELDALNEPLPKCDVIINSLFLHHLTEVNVIRLFERMQKACNKIFINDLIRCKIGHMLAKAAAIFSKSYVVKHDAVTSVEGAFTTKEIKNLARYAKLNPKIVYRFPLRYLLVAAVPNKS